MKATIELSRADVERLIDFCKQHKSRQYFIAKDQGAYLGYSVGSEAAQQCLFYFKGMNPDKDPDWYTTARETFGGDDFGERLDVASITKTLKNPKVAMIRWTLTDEAISIDAYL